MTPTLSAAAQALLFTGGCRLIHAARFRAEPVGTALAATAIVLALILAAVLAALSLPPPDAVSDDAIRALDPAFNLLGP